MWALGVSLFEMMTMGESLFHCDSEILDEARPIVFPAGEECCRGCRQSAELQRIVRWCLSRNPADRPSVHQLFNDYDVQSHVCMRFFVCLRIFPLIRSSFLCFSVCVQAVNEMLRLLNTVELLREQSHPSDSLLEHSDCYSRCASEMRDLLEEFQHFCF